MNVPIQRTGTDSPGGWAKTALLALHASGAHRLVPRSLAGVGAILMLHRVREPDGAAFAPNDILEVTPSFLEATILRLLDLGYDFVTLDEAVRRLAEKHFTKPFIVFTLDDGYRDNLTDAAPVFTRHNIPFTVYLTTGLPDGTAELWWIMLERIIAGAREIHVRFAEGEERIVCASVEEKKAAWKNIYWRLRAYPEDAMRGEIRRLAAEHGIDSSALTREIAMSWDEVRALAANPLASIEAHTADHYALAKLDAPMPMTRSPTASLATRQNLAAAPAIFHTRMAPRTPLASGTSRLPAISALLRRRRHARTVAARTCGAADGAAPRLAQWALSGCPDRRSAAERPAFRAGEAIGRHVDRLGFRPVRSAPAPPNLRSAACASDRMRIDRQHNDAERDHPEAENRQEAEHSAADQGDTRRLSHPRRTWDLDLIPAESDECHAYSTSPPPVYPAETSDGYSSRRRQDLGWHGPDDFAI